MASMTTELPFSRPSVVPPQPDWGRKSSGVSMPTRPSRQQQPVQLARSQDDIPPPVPASPDSLRDGCFVHLAAENAPVVFAMIVRLLHAVVGVDAHCDVKQWCCDVQCFGYSTKIDFVVEMFSDGEGKPWVLQVRRLFGDAIQFANIRQELVARLMQHNLLVCCTDAADDDSSSPRSVTDSSRISPLRPWGESVMARIATTAPCPPPSSNPASTERMQASLRDLVSRAASATSSDMRCQYSTILANLLKSDASLHGFVAKELMPSLAQLLAVDDGVVVRSIASSIASLSSVRVPSSSRGPLLRLLEDACRRHSCSSSFEAESAVRACSEALRCEALSGGADE